MVALRKFEDIEAWQKARELASLLYVSLDQRYISEDVFEKASSLATDVERLASGRMRYLRSGTRNLEPGTRNF